jgi:uncharacterized protein YeaO (DUF488 family)
VTRRSDRRTAIRTARVYDPPSPDGGTRVLVMRLWPRGVRRDRVDRWLRELGPVEALRRAYLQGSVSWDDYQVRYREGLERPEARSAVAEVEALARQGPVTLLCWCPDASRCHRSLLEAYLRQRL